LYLYQIINRKKSFHGKLPCLLLFIARRRFYLIAYPINFSHTIEIIATKIFQEKQARDNGQFKKDVEL
jgi:hypothetical protein